MIKGKTIIELTDVRTGEVERHEDHNLVTNALNKIIEPLGYFKNPSYIDSYVVPLYQKALGGILLFDGQIPEDVNTIFAPASVKMTGCGVYAKQNTTTNTHRGNYNIEESKIDKTNKIAKYVYDFPTSIANGEIACICLTSDAGGYGSYGIVKKFNDYSAYLTNDITSTFSMSYTGIGSNSTPGINEFFFALDKEKDVIYSLKVNSLSSITILERKAYIRSISIFNTPKVVNNSGLGDITKQTTFELTGTGLKNAKNFSYNIDPDSMNLYIFSSESTTITNKYKMGVVEYSLESDSCSEYELENFTGVDLFGPSLVDKEVCVYGGYIYIFQKNSVNLFKISLTAPENFEKIVGDGVAYNNTRFTGIASDGLIFCRHDKGVKIINSETNDILSTEMNLTDHAFIPIFNSPYYLKFSGTTSTNSYGYACLRMNYLATINNLSSHVVKTADKTMKVTYVIQEVDEKN